ncbi:DUF397 domain-containing protein [Streptomyces sp. NPDC053750]|uniref:DUF397 domain-containing protein n=1 Tax=Streptomyces sp. NPDC053750 TaxID=3365714 RepID=UPI0037D4BB6A
METPETRWFGYNEGQRGGLFPYSSGGDGDCVEVAACPTTVPVRDSKDKRGPQLALSPGAWHDFVSYAATPRTA